MDTDRLAELLESERVRFGVPGLGVAVVQDGGLALSRAFGRRDVESDLPVTEQTLFAIASCTKAFTATLIASLVGDGLLEWDRPVREYLPRFQLHDPIATQLVTPRDLLCHRTGLPRHDLLWYADPRIDRREIVEERLRHLPLSKTIRQAWQYNNLMYLTAGYLAGERLGSSWEDAIRSRLLDPLGMSSTCFAPAEASASGDWARAYRDRNGELEELPRKDFPACGPAGSIYSSVADLAQWLLVNANDGQFGGTEVLSADILKETRTPAMPVDPHSPWPEVIPVGYALGWTVEIYRGHRILQHGGGIDGFSSRVALLPEQGAGVAALTNQDGTGLQLVAMYAALDEVLGLEPLPWGDRVHQRERSLRTGMADAQARRGESAQRQPAAHAMSEYAGRYTHPGYGSLVIELDGDQSTLQFGELSFSLAHRHFETWDMTLRAQDMTFPLTFQTDEDGAVSGLRVALEPTVAALEFRRTVDPGLSTAQTLESYAGEYRIGSISVSIAVRDGGLDASVDDASPMRLLPHSADLFTVVGDSTSRMRFVLVDGAVTEAVIEPGKGVLQRQ